MTARTLTTPATASLLLGLAAFAPLPAQDLADGLIHYWSLDAATLQDHRYLDLAGRQRLLCEASAAQAEGRFAAGGTGDWLNGDVCMPAPADMTFSAWVWYDPANDGMQTIASVGNHNRWTLQVLHSNLSFTSDMSLGVVATKPLPAKRWAHVAVTVDDADDAPGGEKQVRLWLDGAQVGSGALTYDATPDLFLIGNSHRGGDHPFTGRMDDLAIWNRALTAPEVASLPATGKPLGELLGKRPTVWVEADATDAAEEGRVPSRFHIRRSASDRDLTVQLSWLGWADPEDYAPLPAAVTIPRGKTEAVLAVEPVDDAIIEGRESVIARIEPSVFYDTRAGSGQATIRIADNDWGSVPKRPRKIYAHFMGCFCAGTGAVQWHATSGLGTMDAPEEARKRERVQLPSGATVTRSGLGKWAAQSIGGTYRNFGLAPYGAALSMEEAADAEIRRAMRIGIDGFTFDAWAGGSGAMQLFDTMIKICEEKNYPFELTVTPDATCLDGNMPELKAYDGDATRKLLRWLIDRHGTSPKLARRDGKILVFGYGAQWTWVNHLWGVAGAKIGPGRPEVEYQREVNRLRTSEEGWKLMGEAYRAIEKDIGQPIYWEMDLTPSLFTHGLGDGAQNYQGDMTLAATRIAAQDFPVMGQFLRGGDVPAMAKAVIAAGKEWSHPILLQYENYGYFQYASRGLDDLRANWEEAREIPSTLIQQITWNDYHETTNLSPGYNSRYAYYDLMGQFIRWWKTGAAPTSDHDRVYLFSHKYVHGARVFPFKANDFADNVIEVVSILPKPARLRLPGRTALDGATEWDAPAGMSFKQFPLTVGPVVAELVRGGKVEIRLENPDPVSDRPFRADVGKTAISTEDARLWREDYGARPQFIYDEYGDVDHDGLPNWFEMLYFGTWGDMTTATVADPQADDDGDGVSNLDEYLHQTDPTDPASK